jgi:hypothetical protein
MIQKQQYREIVEQLVDLFGDLPLPEMKDKLHTLEEDFWAAAMRRYPRHFLESAIDFVMQKD